MKSDVLIIGGSIAGCTAALLYASAGYSVTIIEKKSQPGYYKRLCTHFIQPSALSVIKRLGLDTAIELAGGLPNKATIWTQAGWIRSAGPYSDDPDKAHGYNIERRLLDPLLKERLARQQHICFKPGYEVTGLVFDTNCPDQPSGVACLDDAGNKVILQGRLIIAADGRFSTMADLLNNRGDIYPNNRFACFAYFEEVQLGAGSQSQFWMLNPDMAFAYPLAANKSLLCLFIRKSEWPCWKNDLENKFLSVIRNLPDAPQVDTGRRVSTLYRMMDMPNIYRQPVMQGVGFIGDAALSLDPMSGVGCGFAFQAAAWLVDRTIAALAGDTTVPAALEAYAVFFKEQLYSHATGICADSLAEPEAGSKKMLYQEVINDAELTDAFLALTGRLIPPQVFQSLYLKKVLLKKKQGTTITHLI